MLNAQKQDKIRRGVYKVSAELLRMVRPYERYLHHRYQPSHTSPPPIFIIGSPRSGSTLLYQLVTNLFDVSYISNFTSLFYHSLITGFQLQHLLFAPRPHNQYRSYNGHTKGLRGPHECGKFWYQWFPTQQHFVAGDEYDPDHYQSLRQTVSAITTASQKPLLFKNLNCGQRLQILAQLMPDALFIYCKRDPLYIAQSLLEGRLRVYGDRNEWWSVMPHNYAPLKELPYHQQIVGQIYHLQQQIECDLLLYPQKQRLELHYETFSADPTSVVQQLRTFWQQNGLSVGERPLAHLPKARQGNTLRLARADESAFRLEISRYSW